MAQPEDEAGGPIELEERRWLPRHVAGDAAAFETLVAAYRAPVYGHLVRCGVAPAEQDDLFQEVFMKVHRAASSYQPSRPLAPWLFTIVANSVRSHFRKLKTAGRVWASEAPPERASGEPGPERRLAARQRASRLETALSELPLTQRQALLLTAVEGLSMAEAAAALGVPTGTVKTHVHRARLGLARRLAAEGV